MASHRKTSRRKRLQDILLLLMRMAVLIVLALALSRPLLQGIGGGKASVVVVLDNSYSMGATHNGVSRMTRAKRAAKQILKSLESGSVAAVLYSDGSEPPVVKSFARPSRRM